MEQLSTVEYKIAAMWIIILIRSLAFYLKNGHNRFVEYFLAPIFLASVFTIASTTDVSGFLCELLRLWRIIGNLFMIVALFEIFFVSKLKKESKDYQEIITYMNYCILILIFIGLSFSIIIL